MTARNEPTAETAGNPGRAGIRAERDRFVALAFCWADMLLEVDAERKVVFAAGITDAVLGRSADNLQDRPLDDLVAAGDQALLHELLGVAENSGRIENVSIRLQGRSGPTAPLQFAGYYLPDLDRHFFLSFRVGALPSLKRPGQHLERAPEDGLFEAEAFSEVACNAIGAVSRPGAAASPSGEQALTLLQLDGFEALEQRLDPQAGAQLQRTIGACLRSHSAGGDTAGHLAPGRYSLIHDVDLDVADLEQRIAGYARDADPQAKGVAVDSATIAVDAGNLSEQDLATGLLHVINRFRKSEGSGFTLKSLSRNLSSLVHEAVSAVEGLKGVVAEGAFEMAFHPIANVDTGRYHHYEVLARFPESVHKGSPYRYITFAEETGLICDFDLAMVDKAIRWLATENPKGHYRLAVNLSGHSIGVLSFVRRLHELLEANRWCHRSLLFEITESARIPDLDAANRFIQSLRERGHEVCLDDFGAGAANFQYLSALEVDVIKLDGEALKQAMAGPRGRAFLRALATLCDDLGIEIIAEMVDDLTTYQFVKDCGVRYIQGYLFGRPSSAIRDFEGHRRLDWMKEA